MKKNIYIALAILIVGAGYLVLYYREQQSIRLSECRKEAREMENDLSLTGIFMNKNNCYASFRFSEEDREIFEIKNVTDAKDVAFYADGNINNTNKVSDCLLYSNIDKYKDYNFEKYIKLLIDEKGYDRCQISDEGKEIVKDTWKELTGEEI